jgi:hypothetical protein
MAIEENIFRQLQEHLDRQTVGFPVTSDLPPVFVPIVTLQESAHQVLATSVPPVTEADIQGQHAA